MQYLSPVAGRRGGRCGRAELRRRGAPSPGQRRPGPGAGAGLVPLPWAPTSDRPAELRQGGRVWAANANTAIFGRSRLRRGQKLALPPWTGAMPLALKYPWHGAYMPRKMNGLSFSFLKNVSGWGAGRGGGGVFIPRNDAKSEALLRKSAPLTGMRSTSQQEILLWSGGHDDMNR